MLGTWQLSNYLTMDGEQASCDDLWQLSPDCISTPDKDLEIKSIVREENWDKESYLVSYEDTPVQHLFLRSEHHPEQLMVRAFLEGKEGLRLLLNRVTWPALALAS